MRWTKASQVKWFPPERKDQVRCAVYIVNESLVRLLSIGKLIKPVLARIRACIRVRFRDYIWADL